MRVFLLNVDNEPIVVRDSEGNHLLAAHDGRAFQGSRITFEPVITHSAERLEHLYSVACPHCGAPVGEPCTGRLEPNEPAHFKRALALLADVIVESEKLSEA